VRPLRINADGENRAFYGDKMTSAMAHSRWPKQKRRRLKALCNVALQRREDCLFIFDEFVKYKDRNYVFNEKIREDYHGFGGNAFGDFTVGDEG